MKFFTQKNKYLALALSVTAIISIFLICILSKPNTKPLPDADASEQTSTKERTYNFLLLGKDDAADLCDVIIIVSYDTKTHKIEALQIPRDTYASYTSASYRKLNGAPHALGGITRFAAFIEETLGIPIHYYASTDLETIATVIDKLGGVELCVPEDMSYKDPYQDLTIDLSAGVHLLNGDQATQFLRYRAGYATGDIGRLDAQKIFLAALIKKILNDSDFGDLTTIALNLLPNLETNVSASDCLYFLSQIKHVKMEDIALMTMPGEAIQSQSGAWYYIINREKAYETVKQYFSPSLNYADFDKNRDFTSIYKAGFNIVYDAKNTYKTERYTAYDICRDGISIK